VQRHKDAKEDPGCFGSGSPVEILAVSVVDLPHFSYGLTGGTPLCVFVFPFFLFHSLVPSTFNLTGPNR
jgi:hypothetical protein